MPFLTGQMVGKHMREDMIYDSHENIVFAFVMAIEGRTRAARLSYDVRNADR